MAASVETLEDFEAVLAQVTAVAGKFDRARRGRVPYEAQGGCPVCGGGTVRYVYKGPRSVRMSCDNPSGCYVRLVS